MPEHENFFDTDFSVSKLTYCGLVHSEAARPRHCDRPNWGMAYCVSGETRYVFDDGTVFSVHEGELIFLPRASWYRVTEVRRGLCYAVNFETDAPLSQIPQVVPIRDRNGVPILLRRMEAAWRTKKPGHLFRCRALLYECLYTLQQENALDYGSRKKLERIRPAVEAIHEGYTQELSIAALASLCGVTPEYFRSLFRLGFGTSPLKYINGLRLDRAEELLKTGLYTVTQAAALSGFGDLSRFSREFKRHVGLSPSAYVRERRGQ